MEYTFGGDIEKGEPLSLGLHKRGGKFYEIVEVTECNIVDKDFVVILKEVLNYFREKGIPHYNKKSHTGILRHLVIRKALSTGGEILINLVTSSQGEINLEEFKDLLLGCEKIKGIL